MDEPVEVLEDFAEPQPDKKRAPVQEDAREDNGMDDVFVEQLAKNMEALLLRQQRTPGTRDTPPVEEEVPSMTEILSVFKELSKETPPSSSGGLAAASSTPTHSTCSTTKGSSTLKKPSSLQDHVSRTMSKLKQSDSQVESELSAQAQEDPALELLMKELEGMMQGGDLDNVLGGLMDQILSKELLHEPIKDLASKVAIFNLVHTSLPFL